MKYITAEQFYEQSGEVQEIFLKWWQPEIGDLYCDIDAYNMNHVGCVLDLDKKECIETDKKYNYYLPLLNLQQLIEFVEDKTKFHLEMSTSKVSGFYNIDFYKNKKTGVCGQKYIDTKESERLQAMWQVACKIAQEETNETTNVHTEEK